MDIRNGSITVGEVLRYPPARQVMQQRYPAVLNHPLLRQMQGVSLSRLVVLARSYLPQNQIDALLAELKSL